MASFNKNYYYIALDSVNIKALESINLTSAAPAAAAAPAVVASTSFLIVSAVSSSTLVATLLESVLFLDVFEFWLSPPDADAELALALDGAF